MKHFFAGVARDSLRIVFPLCLLLVGVMFIHADEKFSAASDVNWKTKFNLQAKTEIGADLDAGTIGLRNYAGIAFKMIALSESDHLFRGETGETSVSLAIKELAFESVGGVGDAPSLTVGDLHAVLRHQMAYAELYNGASTFSPGSLSLNEESLKRATRVRSIDSGSLYGSVAYDFIGETAAIDGSLIPEIPVNASLKVGVDVDSMFDVNVTFASRKGWWPESQAANGWNDEEKNNFVLRGSLALKESMLRGAAFTISGLAPVGASDYMNAHSMAAAAGITYKLPIDRVVFIQPGVGVDIQFPNASDKTTRIAAGASVLYGLGPEVTVEHAMSPSVTKLPGIMLSANLLSVLSEDGTATQSMNAAISSYHNEQLVPNLGWDIALELKDLLINDNRNSVLGASAFMEYRLKGFAGTQGTVRPWIGASYQVSLSDEPGSISAQNAYYGSLHFKAGLEFSSFIPGFMTYLNWNSNNFNSSQKFGEVVFGFGVFL